MIDFVTLALAKKGGGGGATSWNDIKDKPFGEAIEKYVDGEFTFTDLDGVYATATSSSMDTYIAMQAHALTKTPIIVVFQGVKYECLVTDAQGECVFGNMALTGGEDTGEPFLGMVSETVFLLADVFATEEVTRQVTVGHLTEEKLDEAYLPANEVYVNGRDAYVYKTRACASASDGSGRLTRTEFATLFNSGAKLIARKTTDATACVVTDATLSAVETQPSSFTYRAGADLKIYYTAEYTGE